MTKRDIHVLSIGIGTDKGAFVPDPQGGYAIGAQWWHCAHSKLMPRNASGPREPHDLVIT